LSEKRFLKKSEKKRNSFEKGEKICQKRGTFSRRGTKKPAGKFKETGGGRAAKGTKPPRLRGVRRKEERSE